MKRVHVNTRLKNDVVSILVIFAGVCATDTPFFSKYCYMVLITLLGLLGVIQVKRQNLAVFRKLRHNRYLVYLGIYMLLITSSRQIGEFLSDGDISHLSAGLGNVIYVLGAAMFFSLYSKERICLFCGSYVTFFCCVFLLTGKWILYDYGDVSRTIGIYFNPNYLAFFALGSVCFSLILYYYSGKFIKTICIISIGLSLAAIINSGSRAMYIGVIISLVIILFNLFFHFAQRRMVSSKKAERIIAFVISLFVIVSVAGAYFSPHMGNAIIDAVHGVDRTSEPIWSLCAPAKDTNNVETLEKLREENSSDGIERILNGAYTTGGSFSTNRRLDIWKSYLERFNEYWLFGSSPIDNGFYFPEFSRVYVTHNTFLNIIFQYGILALLFFIFALWNCFFPASKVRYLSSRNICELCLLSFCVFSCFHDIVDYPLFWCVIALTLRLSNSARTKQNSQCE